MIRVIFILFLVFYTSIKSYSQDTFKILGEQKSYSMSFKLINNLMIILINVNGSTLNFLVDTGLDNSIMFNLNVKDSLKLKNIQQVRLRGLGKDGYMKAFKSTNNLFKIGRIMNGYHMIYLIPGKEFDLSSQMGININGIIGGDLFRDFVIEVNYISKRLKFYKPKSYRYGKCKKCQIFTLEFYKNKPYVNLEIQSEDSLKTNVKLLIDSGGSDALWLFEKSAKNINVPKKYFVDYLGKGLSGNIYGKRAKVHKLIIGDYFFKNANVSYPDSSFVKSVYKHKERNGTLGSEILKRFKIVFDYPHKKIIFKRKSSYYKDPFLYNMSGIELSYSGTMLVKEQAASIDRGVNQNSTSTAIEVVYDYVYAFKKSYQITVLRKDSPAKNAGLMLGDVVLQINGKPAYIYKLQQIMHLFSQKEGKQIKLLIDRKGEVLSYTFRLKNLL